MNIALIYCLYICISTMFGLHYNVNNLTIIFIHFFKESFQFIKQNDGMASVNNSMFVDLK